LSHDDQEFVRAASNPAAGDAGGDVPNFDAPWPQDVRFTEDPQIQVVSEDKENKRFVYESANFRFVCDARLSQQVVKGFSVMFESTRDYCRALPLGLTGGVKTNGKFQILLFEKKEDYVSAGGPSDSAGVFIGNQQAVLVPLESLGVKKVGSGYMLDRSMVNRTLIHELTHQLTPESYFEAGSKGWFSEGLAEYIASTPYRSGRFKVRSNLDDIVDYATGYAKVDNHGRALGKKFSAPPLKEFMALDYHDFTGQNGNFNYGLGLMLTTYFLQLDGKGDAARAKEFLKRLRAGKTGDEAVQALLDGRSYGQLQEDFTKAWKRMGVEIKFQGN
jgi:hypothetical protein